MSILFSFSCFGQAAEPTNFEWKKTVEINRRLETFYNENVLTNMPPNARFWVDIKPISSKTLKVTYANGGYKVYQSHEKLENKFNDVPFNHGYLLGARTTEQQTTYCICSDNSAFPEPEEYTSINCVPLEPSHNCIPVTETIESYKPNDGVVLVESAVDFPGAVYHGALHNSCHFQMRNDGSTKGMMLELFDETGDSALKFFETEEL